MAKKPTKKLLSLGLVLALALSLGLGGLLPAATAAEGDTFDFQVLFTSDLHGCFYDWSYSTNSNYYGLARVAAKIDELRDENTILIDVGDTIQGNGTTTFLVENSGWEGMYPVLQGMEYLGYDAWVLGNHEFNFGIPALERAYGKGLGADGGNLFSGAVLAGNVVDSDGNAVFDAYTVKTFDNGLRVAIIGMTHPNIVNWDAANMTAAGYDAISPSAEAEKAIAQIIANDEADICILAFHMGEDARSDSYVFDASAVEVLSNKSIADNVVLFLGAHDHGAKDKMVNEVRYVELASNGAQLGQVKITATETADGWVVADKENDTSMTRYIMHYNTSNANYGAPDEAYKEAIKPAHDFGVANAMTVIGEYIGEPLVPDPEINGTYEAYLQDTALVHLINDAMLYYTNKYVAETDFYEKYPQYAGMEVTLSGTAPLDTNANHKAGPITKGSVAGIYKYDNNTLSIMAITGAQFKMWMEWAYSFIGPFIDNQVYEMGPAMNPGDLLIPYGNGNMAGYNMDQFTGVSYKVDLTKPVGERIVDLVYDVTGEPFDLEETYLLAVNNYRSDSQLTNANSTIVPGGIPKSNILATEVEAIVPGTGEGMLGVMIDYIQNPLGGIIDNTGNKFFTPNWEYILPEIDPVLRAKAVEAVNSGAIDIVVGGYNRRTITAEEIKALDSPAAAEPGTPDTPSVIDPGAYTVVRGDSLWRISQKYFGTGTRWSLIYDLNKGVIGSDPNLIFAGQIFMVA